MRSVLLHFVSIFFLLFSINSFAEEAVKESDPWEGFNRTMFSFNETLDEYVLLLVTKGYQAIAPEPVEKGVHNFFSNLGDVGVILNSLFQLKVDKAAHSTARFVANTFFGIGGLFDVATPMGLEKQDEDFGQTLGYWGVDTGPYIVLPLFGPSNVRDGIGLIPDYYMDPLSNFDDDDSKFALQVLRVVDTRAELMEAEKLISGDRYTFIRDAYMQRRDYLVNDGEVSDEFQEDGF